MISKENSRIITFFAYVLSAQNLLNPGKCKKLFHIRMTYVVFTRPSKFFQSAKLKITTVCYLFVPECILYSKSSKRVT